MNEMNTGEHGFDLREYRMKAYRETIAIQVAEIERLQKELETERMRLTACGVVAMADTPESAATARNMLPEYRSASCDDVARRVDECMRLREEVDQLNTRNQELRVAPESITSNDWSD